MDKIPFPKLHLRGLTALAIGSGIGAALGTRELPLWLLPCAVLFLLLLDPRRKRFYAVGLVVCLLSGAWWSCRHDRELAALPPHAMRMEGELLCADRRTTSVEALSPPGILHCEVEADGLNFPAAVILPADSARMLCGQRARFVGRYSPAVPAGLEFDGQNMIAILPPLYGDRPLLIVDELHLLPAERGFWSWCFALRDRLLRRMLNGVRDPAVGAMAAKMFFNAGTGAGRELRSAFAASGTIHIFAVSGLHVTVLALLLLWLLRPLPFVARYRLVALLIPVYVCCTGASLPAVRAGAMVCAWCILRSMLFFAPGWNAMAMTFCAFAMWAPETVSSLGAQYSFGITAALILMLERVREPFGRDRELLRMMPARAPETRRKRRFFRWKHRLITAVCIALTAFAAAAGLSLYRQHLLVPGSIAANLLLPLLTPLLFGGLIFKLTLGVLSGALDALGAELLSGGFHLLSGFVTAMSEWFGPVAAEEPPFWTVAVFYLLLFTALGSRRRAVGLGCAAAAALLLILPPLFQSASPGTITVISRGANTPALVACLPPGGETALVVNVPDSAVGALIGRQLRAQGALRAEVGFTQGVRRCSAGLGTMARQLPCTAFVPMAERKPSAAFLRQLRHENIRCRENVPNFALKIDGRSATWILDDGTVIRTVDGDAGRLVTVTLTDGRIERALMPWSSLPLRWRIPAR